MDVKTLYSSIPHSDGIKACETFMIENGFPSMEVSNITKIIDFILAHNYFELNDKSYIQAHGTAMRTKMAPTYANILCETLRNICWITAQTNLFYIDDIFVIWQHDENKLEQFHAYVNSMHPNINLTLTSSAANIPYLDVSVSFDGTNLHTSIYTMTDIDTSISKVFTQYA